MTDSLIGPIDEAMQIAAEKYMRAAGFEDLPEEVPGTVRQLRMWAADGFAKGWVAAREHYKENQ